LVAASLTIAGFSAVAVVTGAFAVVTTFSLPACTAANDAGAACSSVAANNGNGETTCGDSICAAGTYCVSDAGDGCSTGCIVTAQCPFGNYCDLTNAAPDLAGNSVGTCTQPTLQQQAPCADGGGADAASSAGDAGH
jgi:hypothetical protein